MSKKKLKQVHKKYNNALTAEAKATEEREKAEREFINECVDSYREESLRIDLIKSGRKLCYSESKLQSIESHFSAWNMDKVDINLAEEILELEIYVDQHKPNIKDRFTNIFVEESENNK